MSKATTKGTHWGPRVSSYSLHGQRTGRVDVLPPTAKDPFYLNLEARKARMAGEISECDRECNRLRHEILNHPALSHIPEAGRARKAVLHKMLKATEFIGVSPELVELIHRLQAEKQKHARLRLEYRDLVDSLSLGDTQFLRDYDRVWVAMARSVLPQDSIDRIESLVAEQLRVNCK